MSKTLSPYYIGSLIILLPFLQILFAYYSIYDIYLMLSRERGGGVQQFRLLCLPYRDDASKLPQCAAKVFNIPKIEFLFINLLSS